MPEYRRPCNCNWRAGCGPNLLCPEHGNTHHMGARIAELEAELQAVVDAAKDVVESEADARRQQATHWKNPTIDILEQAIKEVE